MRISLRRLQSEEEIKKYLDFFSKEMYNNLYSMGIDVDAHARKLYTLAEVYVALAKKDPVGLISFYCNDIQAKEAYLGHIVVRKEYRGKGVGTILISKLFECCESCQMQSIKLQVGRDNIKAINFYEKFGFSQCMGEGNSLYMKKVELGIE